MSGLVRVCGGCLGVLALAVLPACTKNVATGESFFNPISTQDEIAMGQKLAPEFTAQSGGRLDNAVVNSYVTGIGRRLAAATEGDFPNRPWEFTVLNSSVINAFALPGGKVFISRGLMEKMTNESQLAGVLGHEVGHVTAQHIAKRMGQQTLFNIGLTSAQVAAGAAGERSDLGQVAQVALPAIQVGGNLVFLKFGRDEESQADSLGLRYMTRIGYNPRGMLEVMQILDREAGAGGQPEWLSTHPLPKTRIQRIQGSLAAAPYATAVSNPASTVDTADFQRVLAELRRLPRPTAADERAAESLYAQAYQHHHDGQHCGGCGGSGSVDSGGA